MSISKIFECYLFRRIQSVQSAKSFNLMMLKMLDDLSTWNENLLDEVIFENSAERGDRESVYYLLHIWKQN